MLLDQARSDRTGEIIDIRCGHRIVVTEHIAYAENEPLNQRIAVTKPRQDFDMCVVAIQDISGDFLQEGTPEV
jgi:hypothetical protein